MPATFDICQPFWRRVDSSPTSASMARRRCTSRSCGTGTSPSPPAWSTTTTPMLLKGVESGRLQPRKLVTHRFALDDIMHAHETFEHAAREGSLKVILTNETRG